MKKYFAIVASLVMGLPVGAQVPTAVKGGTKAVSKASKAAVAPKGELHIPAVPSATAGNTLSRTQIRQVALEMRNHQFKSKWTVTPNKPLAAEAKNEFRLGSSGANLTGLSPAKWEEAYTHYANAVSSVQKLAQYMDTQIYYMGTSESERPHPEQIRQTLADINDSLAAVKKAQITFGENKSLAEMGLYLSYAKRFYTMLGSGMLEPLDEKALTVIPREDNHTFVSSEFSLWSEFVREKLPNVKSNSFFNYLTSLLQGSVKRGALPQKLRVAILQDDNEAIKGLQEMQTRGKLTEWQIDYLEPDAEAFLNRDYNSYDLILSDIVMPHGGGRYLARQLRAGGYKGSLLVVSKFDYYYGDSFFKDGFDGMLFLGEAEKKDFQYDFASWFWSRLKNYYQLKAKHGWQH